ncbi:MAG: hypothetical protein ACLRVD_15945 [Blautia caecimuris]|nr:hypothetical protein [uncultured Blautia sp.]
MMNKLMGFYELKDMNIPSVPWKEYTSETRLKSHMLWTVRTAVFNGDDLNLPRKVGVVAEEAQQFGDKMLKEFEKKGITIYYPYFIANKSGNLNVFSDKIVIEAVKDDLWNLVTYSDRDVTVIIESNDKRIIGNKKFLQEEQLNELLKYVPTIRRTFRDDLLEGKSVMLEWSFANKSDINKEPIDEEFLVFYEARTVK